MALQEITYLTEIDGQAHATLSGYPDICPACGHAVSPKFRGAYELPRQYAGRLAAVFQCTLKECKCVFVGYYAAPRLHESYFILNRSFLAAFVRNTEHPESIKSVSSAFCEIYEQSLKAEENGLLEVCGCGYRRALEFLIKDYLVSLCSQDQAAQDEIQALHLSKCIARIKDQNIQDVAKRAAWLGNDETHYLRKWDDMQLSNLKDLLKLTVYWIDAAISTERYKKQMPD